MGVLSSRVVVLAAFVATSVLTTVAAQAQDRLGEYQVKAAFLYNFVKFVQWPTGEASSPIAVCIVGDDPFGDLIDTIADGKSAHGRVLAVWRPKLDSDLKACQVVFVSASEARRTPELLERLQLTGVLTIGETPHFLREGGVIRFYVDGNRVRFQISSANAERAGLRISAQLLSLAKQ